MSDTEKTKEQLLEELELLRILMDNLPDRLYVKDKNGRFIFLNEAVYGDAEIPPPGDIIGKSDFDLFPPDKAGVFYAEEQNIIKTGRPMVNKEVVGTRRDTGQPHWSLSTKLPWRNSAGEIIGIIGANRDITDRKIAELALQESEARYKAIFESTRIGIIFADAQTRRFLYSNPAAYELFGYTNEQFTRMGVEDIHPKDWLTQAKRDFDARVSRGKEITRNAPCLRRDGSIFYADINTAGVVIQNRPCLVGFFTDITERKHTEDALRESEARYKAIFNSATEGIIVTDVETKRHRYVNPAACRMFGYTAEEFQQMTVYDIHPKKYMPSVIAGLEAQARGEKTLVPDVPCLHRDGTVFYADIDATCIVIDQRPCNVGLFTNITERKQAEEALRQSEEKFRGLTERSFDMVFMTDAKGVITYLSPASERIFGFAPEEMVGKHFMNFLVESEIPKAAKRFKEKLQGKPLDSLLLEAKKKNGSRVFIELISSLIMKDGISAGTQGIIRDVTDRKKAEEELLKAHQELERRVQQRTADLAAAVEKLQKEIAERKHAEESLRNAEQRFRTIFENTMVGLYRTTPRGRILLANPALIKMMGCKSFKELAKFNVEKKGFDPSIPRSIFKQQIEKEGKVAGLESIWLRPDGGKLFVSESATAVKDEKGNVLYYEGTAQNISKRKEAEAKLLHYQQQLRSLATQLSMAEEGLRRRIASELHDNISQNLAISKMKLESLIDPEKPDLSKPLEEVIGLIAQTINVSRTLTFEMSPPVLYELGFESAISWLVRQTRQRFGLDVVFTDDGKPKLLETDVRVILFHAVRELLVNVVKHAKAHIVKVSAGKINGKIRIIVEDDGAGFKISGKRESKSGGFGLFNIRERLAHIGGSVDIRSPVTPEGRGTKVTLIAPLSANSKSLNEGVKNNAKNTAGRRPQNHSSGPSVAARKTTGHGSRRRGPGRP